MGGIPQRHFFDGCDKMQKRGWSLASWAANPCPKVPEPPARAPSAFFPRLNQCLAIVSRWCEPRAHSARQAPHRCRFQCRARSKCRFPVRAPLSLRPPPLIITSHQYRCLSAASASPIVIIAAATCHLFIRVPLLFHSRHKSRVAGCTRTFPLDSSLSGICGFPLAESGLRTPLPLHASIGSHEGQVILAATMTGIPSASRTFRVSTALPHCREGPLFRGG